MSVCLHTLKDANEYDIEVWAPDYDKEFIWLTQDIDVNGDDWVRINFTIAQLKELRAVIDGFFDAVLDRRDQK